MTRTVVKQVRLPYPHPGQQGVELEGKRFNWLSAGRRWRKTTFLMARGVTGALAGKRILWGSPTYKQMMIAWEEFDFAVGNVADFK